MGEIRRDFPLFLLDLVALPHEVVPLHIFEERYRTMISDCLESETEFGIVWATSEGLRPVGCAMEITEVLERHEDGRLDILTVGRRPFTLLEEHHHHAHPAGDVEMIEDAPEVVDEAASGAAQAAYGSLVMQATDHVMEPEALGAMDAYAMAATVDLGAEAKQGLLDLRSENARLRLVTRLLLAATKRLDFIERAQARARSNGKVRFG
jgi:Lon protease-like protein